MPVPLLWLGAGAIVLLTGKNYKTFNVSIRCISRHTNVAIDPINGAIVSCGNYGLFKHTGSGQTVICWNLKAKALYYMYPLVDFYNNAAVIIFTELVMKNIIL